MAKKGTVFYFVAIILDQTQKLTVMAGHVLKCARRVFEIPDFYDDYNLLLKRKDIDLQHGPHQCLARAAAQGGGEDDQCLGASLP
jgi:hypothetical protein